MNKDVGLCLQQSTAIVFFLNVITKLNFQSNFLNSTSFSLDLLKEQYKFRVCADYVNNYFIPGSQ
jgi:hypothetical protein